ncbi:MAG TPA: ferrochelatase, partial [Phycisphaerae bacterium]|nr:ferrochelatase [Phycisphaerae bacterium]
MTQPNEFDVSSSVDSQDALRKPAVLLVNVGSPDGPDVASVRRYLGQFLRDPLVIQLPSPLRWCQPWMARMIAWRRAPYSAEKYQSIWTPEGSPLRVIVEQQAAALGRLLGDKWRVFTAMRYGHPSIAEAVQAIMAEGIEDLVVLPLYPQYSPTTTGTVAQELYTVLKQSGAHINVTARTSWYDDAGYAHAQARLIADYAAEHDLGPHNSVLLYSAHGLPVAYVERGDPYAAQLKRSIEIVTERLGWPVWRTRVGYQSRMGPAAWLKPDTTEVLTELAVSGEKQVLLCPISFAVDCLETLEEIDIRYREHFEGLGGRLYRCPALNTSGHFINAMKNLVIRGPRPVTHWNEPGLLSARMEEVTPRETDAQLQRLFMVGISLPSRIGPGCGPRLVYSSADQLRRIKKGSEQVQTLLTQLQADGHVCEAMVWNTCHRFEFYGWLEEDEADRACTVARIRRDLLDDDDGQLRVNLLFGSRAWHHMMRTVIGLNSGLPGDRDVLEQFQNAHRLAERAGTSGPRLKALVDEAVAVAQSAQAETAWGRESSGYCYAALARIQGAQEVRLANCRHVVIGGSATSRSVLHSLFEHFEARESDTTLVYRTHQSGQTKLLRKVIGNGRRIRVDTYASREIVNAIADADVVYFGIDSEEPVLTAEQLSGLRDFTARPLMVVDFNTAGSTSGLEKMP